ncbi:hypothetical protein CIK06_08225 [Plantactinospora sp. KBS50]|nr:hypothetical protein [Plantactinospora sp. KBS50]ASW54186.1 hypothetical protein CIK06_08225 [Plantactinospora sp. KBS50]
MVRRAAPWVLALALLSGGCAAAPQPPATVLRAGFDTLDGTLAVWPARGSLADDRSAAASVSRAVSAWRSPAGDRAYLPASGILWLGEADGTRLALVAASVPGNDASWLVQLRGRDGADFSVERAVEYPDPGYLVYSDVLPVPLSDGRRYLTSARVERLTGPDGKLSISDGLSAPVQVPACAPVAITASLRPTESLPDGKRADRMVDLGSGVGAPRYPLVGDDSNTASAALEGLDTCALGTEDGPFGSVERRIAGRDEAGSMPASWPIDRITSRSLGDVTLGIAPPAELDQLSWRTDSGVMTAVVLRPPSGPPSFSAADRFNPLQSYELTVGGTAYVALVWRAAPDSSVSVPSATSRLVDRPGLVIVAKPADRQTFSLVTPDKTYYRSVNE